MACIGNPGFAAVLSLLVPGCAIFGFNTDANNFAGFLTRVDRAQVKLQQGVPEPYKALWSHGEDVTLAGGFGGSTEQGWAQVSKRLDWAGSNFVNGRNEIRRLAFAASGDIGYLVQTEHLRFSTPDASSAERNYRVTMLFRRENGVWRIIHRHADSQITKEAPR